MSGSTARNLSKSRYLSGLQCSKRLWTEVRSPELVPPFGPATLGRFEQGHRVGELAKRLFPGGLEIDPGVRRWDRVVKDTRRALTQRRPLYEAGFRAAGAACRVDILTPVTGERWDVLEVKSSTGVKEVHLSDLALQAHVLEASGISVRDYYLVHLDATYVRQGPLDPQSLFHRELVTEEVRDRLPEVESRLTEMAIVMDSDQAPEVLIGRQCSDPYECPLKTECWAFLPPDNVFDLVRGRSRGFDFLARGMVELQQIPLDEDLSVKQRIQLEALHSGRPHIDVKALRELLDRLVYPVFYFDIETFSSALPEFDGIRPYQQVPFLFSIHRVEHPGRVARHFAYAYEQTGDPRPDFLRATRSALESEGSIVAYNAPFEKGVLQDATQAVLPEMSAWADDLESRFVDLLVPFRDFAYHHPGQRGRASLKAVLGPLTGMSYSDLEIADGETASREYLRLISTEVDPIERARVMRQLEEYCSLDTLGMVAIVDRLGELVS